ncbi:hypothetical protein CY0110_01340 [Crocosphaera chwakensis CCY0110]|uniref:Uncharacterized protein n=1 Tax=Crocosphaera chwakensis CCY0110 TaxID=391612 RepID=A3IWU3_9CHRO|nr:hypothetical protein CY0110_01340 [Crocosphaera chwakensis CCY0110]
MLCHQCSQQSSCLAYQLASVDRNIKDSLTKLKSCTQQLSSPPKKNSKLFKIIPINVN